MMLAMRLEPWNAANSWHIWGENCGMLQVANSYSGSVKPGQVPDLSPKLNTKAGKVDEFEDTESR